MHTQCCLCCRVPEPGVSRVSLIWFQLCILHNYIPLLLCVLCAGQWKKPLPSDIDVAVPAKIRHLVKFVEPLAHRWDRIGHGLGIENVKELVGTQMDGTRKMTRIFETWEERSPKWTELLRVLENDVKLTAAASGIRAFLLEGQWVHVYYTWL